MNKQNKRNTNKFKKKRNKTNSVNAKSQSKPIIITDFTLSWLNNNCDEQQKLTDIKQYINNGNMFSVIIPEEYTKYITVPFNISISHEELLSKITSSEKAFLIYKATKTIVITNK
tara:strand:+ start:809 stop:1153 length:345 start_codon:yes stop_codon:yes gene_type:complete